MAVQEAVWAAQGYNQVTKEYLKVPARVIVVLDAPDKVEDVWLPEVRKWFDVEKWVFKKNGKPKINEIELNNGSAIKFMFHLQEPLAFESLEAQNMVVYDEPPPRHVFIALKRASRTRGHKTRHLMVGTPLAAPWLRENVYEPWTQGALKDTECFRFGTNVNLENLSEGYVEEFSRHMTDKEKRIRLEGEFFDLEGLALAHLFKRGTHIVEPFDWPSNWPCVVSIDPAMSKPHVACIVGANHEGQLFYITEMALKAHPAKFADELRKWYSKYPITDIVCDSLGNTPQTGGRGMASFIDVLNECGVRARATSFRDKDDERWIEMIQQVLAIPEGSEEKPPRLSIFKGNRGIVSDIENVQWQKFKNEDIYKPKLDISKKDYLATLKYALATRIGYSGTTGRARTWRAQGGVNWRDRSKY